MGAAAALKAGRVATEAKAAKARFWVADLTAVRAAVDLRRRRAALEDILILLDDEDKKKNS
jgi:hypothetical protein